MVSDGDAALGRILLRSTVDRNLGVCERSVMDDPVLIVEDCSDTMDRLMSEFGLLGREDVEVPCGKRMGALVSELMEIVGGEVNVLRVVIRFGVFFF